MEPVNRLDAETNASINSLTLHELEMPLVQSFRSGIGTRNTRSVLVIQWGNVNGEFGYGEVSCRHDPFYSSEYTAAAVDLVKRFVVPALQKDQTYGQFLRVLDRIRGWPFTRSAVEIAAINALRTQLPGLQADKKVSPLLQLVLADDSVLQTVAKVEATQKIPVGISLGIFDSEAEVISQVTTAIDQGYRRIKMKISPNVNLDHIASAASMVERAGLKFEVDANGSFTPEVSTSLIQFAKKTGVVIEQPFPPDRLDWLIDAREHCPQLRCCLDESITSIGDLISAHRLGLLEELNLKVGRVGGPRNALAMIAYCYEHDIDCWLGGMFETGVGRSFNLELASLLPKAHAHDLSPSSRYYANDLIEPPIEMHNGFVDVGLAEKKMVRTDRIQQFCISTETFNF